MIGAKVLSALGVLVIVSVPSVRAATETKLRLVGVTQVQWASTPQDAGDSQRALNPPPTGTRASHEGVSKGEPTTDLFDSLSHAATQKEKELRRADERRTPPVAEYRSAQTSVQSERLAAADRPAETARNAPQPTPQLSPDTSAGAQEVITIPEPEVGPSALIDGAPQVGSQRSGPGEILFGCPYYPTQSGAHVICGVDCGRNGAPCYATWDDARPIPWSLFGPGEYVGPPRIEHVSTYFLRVNDFLTLTYIASAKKTAERYRIGVGDRLHIESKSDETLIRDIQVQPDGSINLPLIGDVEAAGKTIAELRDELIERFGRIEQQPLITVTPLEVNSGLREILKAVTSQSRSAGQAIELRVTPEGTIQVPGLGSVYVQGLTLEEARSELEARYAATFGPGLLISPALTERATSYAFVGGEVKSPGRYTLEGPTTVMQAITLAGGWNVGGNVRQVVVFRRDENWCLKATKINVRAPLYGADPCPVNDVWLRDNDLVIVPKQRILCAADVIDLYFTRGVYGVFPITFVQDFSTGTVVP